MNTLVFEGKWFPNNVGGNGGSEDTGKALRIVNIDSTSGNVKVKGGNSSIYGEPTRSSDINKLQYKRKGASKWNAVPSNGVQLSCAQGAYIDFRYKHIEGNNIEMNYGLDDQFVNFSANFVSELSGELDSLQLDPTTTLTHGKFHSMFYNFTKLKHASALVLPTQTGSEDYCQLFNRCTTLVTPPQENFPITATIGNGCFMSMFEGCEKLTTAMNITPSGFAGSEACKTMYAGCASLTTPATMNVRSIGLTTTGGQFKSMYEGAGLTNMDGVYLSNAPAASKSCCQRMFQDCIHLIGVPYNSSRWSLPGTTANECYKHMFKGCASLTVTPTLPATTVRESSYLGMFEDCVDLLDCSYTIENISTIYASGCADMFKGCSNLTANTINLSNIITINGNSNFAHMFESCSDLNPTQISLPEVSELPGVSQMAYMFQHCTSLTAAPQLPYTKLGTEAYEGMFWGCTNLSTAPDLLIEDSTNLGQLCYEGMFNGCLRLNFIRNRQTDWFTKNGNFITLSWVQYVSETGTYKCHPDIAADPEKLIYDMHHIPYNDAHKWNIEADVETPAWTRYQDKTTTLTNQWSGISVYDSTNNTVSDYGFYRNNSVNHTRGSSSDKLETYVIHFKKGTAGDSVPYPWANPERYTFSAASAPNGWTPGTIPTAITYDNSDHSFKLAVNNNLAAGVYPIQNTSGLTSPALYHVSYKDGEDERDVQFVFIIDDEATTDQDVLLLGASTASEVTVDGIPTDKESYVMIKKFNKSTGAGITDWCDVTGYKKLVIPVGNNEWLGVKNGALDLKRDGSSVINTSAGRGTLHFSTNKTTGGIITGNIRGLGSPYFQGTGLASWYGDDVGGTVNINMWGEQCCKGMFSGTTWQTVSENLFANCSWWSAPSGCYQMFKGCTKLNNTPAIPGNPEYGYWFDYMFYQMFANTTMNDVIARTITNTDTKYGPHAAQRMFAGSTLKGFNFDDSLYGYDYAFFEMFKGCTNLLGDYTDSFNIDYVEYFGCAGMFSGCTSLVFFDGTINWTGSMGTSFDNNNDATFSAAFKDCTSLSEFTFFSSTPSDDKKFRTQSQMFESMFEGCTNLYQVNGFYLKSSNYNSCKNMFKGCTRLTNADINIDIGNGDNMGTGAFYNMFSGCTSLPRISLLNVKHTQESCCQRMFSDCTNFSNNNNKINLTNYTSLRCYYAMFTNCQSLYISPNVIESSPISTYAHGGNRSQAFSYMFSGCGSLTDFDLKNMVDWYNTTTLYNPTYDYMFAGCSSLNFAMGGSYYSDGEVHNGDVDDLPVVNCAGPDKTVEAMFSGCTALEYTPIMICPSNSNRYYDCFAYTFANCTNLSAGGAIFIFSPKERSAITNDPGNFIGPFGNGTWVNTYDKAIKIITNVSETQYSFKTATGDSNCAWTQIWAYDTAWDYVIDWSKINQNS